MGWIDGVDIGRGLMPRRWRRYVALAFLATLLLFPNPAQRAMFWYAHECAERIVNIVLDSTRPEPGQVPAVSDR